MKVSEDWQEALSRVRAMRDTLGRSVDKNIEETVAVLLAMGIHTTMSCAGHIDRDTGGPYVTFAHEDIAMYKQVANAIDNPADASFKEAVSAASKLNFDARLKIWGCLEAFYEQRSVPYSQQLTVLVRPFSNTLTSHSAVNLAHMGVDERKEMLLANQDEMMNFTKYLRSVSG